jgi:hypothetical protein
VVGTLRLAQAMQQTGVRNIVFSSSATVYGEPDVLPLREDHKLAPFSPYGRTKLQAEELLIDIAHSLSPLNVAILRYFNPVGSHESGLIGEDPNGVPNNLMPYISRVAIGRLPVLNVFGNDYPTSDGTGIRDYVHVVDLAAGHVAALDHVHKQKVLKVNLGTGRGTSVLELVDAYTAVSGRTIPCPFAPRRPGDIASYYASGELAEADAGMACPARYFGDVPRRLELAAEKSQWLSRPVIPRRPGQHAVRGNNRFCVACGRFASSDCADSDSGDGRLCQPPRPHVSSGPEWAARRQPVLRGALGAVSESRHGSARPADSHDGSASRTQPGCFCSAASY